MGAELVKDFDELIDSDSDGCFSFLLSADSVGPLPNEIFLNCVVILEPPFSIGFDLLVLELR